MTDSIRRSFTSSVFCVHEKEVLLIHHKRLDLWLPLGGELEKTEAGMWETPQEAARREACEEAGYKDYEVFFPALPNNAGLYSDGVLTRQTMFFEPSGFLGYEEHMAGSKGLHMNFIFVALVKHKNVVSDGSWDDHVWITPGRVIVHPTTPNVRYCLTRIEQYGDL
jgi:8-oxo-dGTP diphosphatase